MGISLNLLSNDKRCHIDKMISEQISFERSEEACFLIFAFTFAENSI